MKRVIKTLLAIAAPLLFALSAQAQTTVTVGAGTAVSRFPLGNWWGFERSAAIYTAAEVNTSGILTRLSWYLTTANTGTVPIRIYLAHTSASTLTTGNWNTKTTGATVVYFDSARVLTANSWNDFNLQTNFAYNGTSNLLVLVETNWGGGGNGDVTRIQYSTATTQHWTVSSDNTPSVGAGATNSNRPNIRLYFPPAVPDMRAQALLSPASVPCNQTSYNLSFRVRNGGIVPITSGSYVRYGYRINGGTPVRDSVQLSSDLAVNGTYDFTVNGVNIASVQDLDFRVWSNVDSDIDKTNDSMTFRVTNPQCITTDMYSDFESNNGGWSTNLLWAWGTPTKAPFTAPPSGTKAWVTDLNFQYPINQSASLYSPFFDFSNSCTPTFTWRMRYDVELDYDGLAVEVSTDNVNWTKLTTINPGYNNSSTNSNMPPPQYSGDNGGWLTYTADLSAYSQEPMFRLRIRFESDYLVADNGVAIDNASFSLMPVYTGAAFVSPDSVYQGAMYDTEITTTAPDQAGINFVWELDGVVIANTKDLDYIFPTTGTFELKQKAVNICGWSMDSASRTIVVIAPTAKPEADFISDKNNVATFEVVTMTNLTDQGPSYYEWYVSPDVYIDPATQLTLPSVSYSGGTNANSKHPQMAFFGDGVYDVCLIAENAHGRDTTCKSQYIIVGGPGVGADSIMCDGTSTNAPSGRVYDSGGPNGDYLDGENCIFTIDFNCYDSLYMDFSFFNVENNWDFLRIYDGGMTGTPLWNTTLYPNGMTNNTALPVVSPATSGMVTIVFTSDPSVPRPGFVLNYRAASQINSVPVANFVVPDTLCAAYNFTFDNTSTSAHTYYWDFFGLGSVNSTDEDPDHIYAIGGVYNVKLVVVGCAGSDTLVKPIVVTNPGLNTVAFGSPFTTYTTNDIVRLYDSTDGCVDTYSWRITPDRVSFLGGMNDQHTTVQFDTAGVYTVTLITENAAGIDSLQRTGYITVVDICTPTIMTNVSDVGISRVSFANLDNSSAPQGTYTDYNLAATVEKGRTYELKVYRSTLSNALSRKVWIDWNADGDFTDANELVASEAPARTAVFTAQIGIPRTVIDGMVTMRVSTSYGNQANEPCGTRSYGETEDYRVIIVPDNAPPVITLLGNNPVFVNRNDMYVDAGATAMDNLDGDRTPYIIAVSNVDSSVAGQYEVTYDVTDSAGNNAVQVTRTVIVLPDAPVITLTGSSPDFLDVFNQYADPGALAVDFDNNVIPITVISHVDSSVTGPYTIEYSATDANGRTTTIVRDVIVVDRVAPTGLLDGDDTITVEVFGMVPDHGISLADNYCISGQYTIDPVNVTVLGYVDMVYRFADCEGNTASVTRVVEVVDTKAPVIVLKGALGVNHYRQHAYLDSGYTLSDNYYANAQITVETLTTLVSTEEIGLYTYQYRATDGSGNTSLSEVRYIYIIDNVGVEDVVISDLSVYPNPNAGNFTVSFEAFAGDDVKILVSDISGKQVQVENLSQFEGSHNIDLSKQAAGMYLVHVISGNRQAVAKVMIAK